MPDPARAFPKRQSNPQGVGPFRFRNGTDFGDGSLDSGERETLNLRAFEEQGVSGWYVVLSEEGYDVLNVINRDTGNSVDVLINESQRHTVPPSQTKSLGVPGMYRFDVTNVGGTAIAQGDVILEILKEPFGADKAARERQQEPALRGVIRNFTGI